MSHDRPPCGIRAAEGAGSATVATETAGGNRKHRSAAVARKTAGADTGIRPEALGGRSPDCGAEARTVWPEGRQAHSGAGRAAEGAEQGPAGRGSTPRSGKRSGPGAGRPGHPPSPAASPSASSSARRIWKPKRLRSNPRRRSAPVAASRWNGSGKRSAKRST